jgi:predicted house-cleaning noncanonical NTP pyrophosphatase (MazG superfamily)
VSTTTTMTTIHNKLVRDKIPDLLRARGIRCEVEQLDAHRALASALVNKLAEEASEVKSEWGETRLGNRLWLEGGRDAVLKELADVSAVLDSLREAFGFSSKELTDAIENKEHTHGAFLERLYLVSTTEP